MLLNPRLAGYLPVLSVSAQIYLHQYIFPMILSLNPNGLVPLQLSTVYQPCRLSLAQDLLRFRCSITKVVPLPAITNWSWIANKDTTEPPPRRGGILVTRIDVDCGMEWNLANEPNAFASYDNRETSCLSSTTSYRRRRVPKSSSPDLGCGVVAFGS